MGAGRIRKGEEGVRRRGAGRGGGRVGGRWGKVKEVGGRGTRQEERKGGSEQMHRKSERSRRDRMQWREERGR